MALTMDRRHQSHSSLTDNDQKKLDWEKHLEKLQEDFFKMKSGSDKFSYTDRKVIDNGSVTVETEGFPRPRSRAGYISTDNPLYKDTPEGGLKFHIEFHMEGYKPEEITVKTDGGTLFVHARHEEVKDGTRRTSSEYKRKVEVPPDVDPDSLNSFFTSDGVLTIEAPVLPEYNSLNRSTQSNKSSQNNKTEFPSFSARDFDVTQSNNASDFPRPKSSLGLERPSSSQSEGYPSYVQSLKRQPKQQSRSSRYSLGGSELHQPSKKHGLGRKSLGQYRSTGSLPGQQWSSFGRTSPAPLSLVDQSYSRNREDSDRDSVKSSPGYFHSLPRGGATGALSIKTDFPPQTDDQETSDLETSPKSPGLIRDILNGTGTDHKMLDTSSYSNVNESLHRQAPSVNGHLTNGYLPEDTSQSLETSKRRSYSSDATDAGYMSSSTRTTTPADLPLFFPQTSESQTRSSRASLGGPLTSRYIDNTLDGSLIATTDRNGNYKKKDKRFSFGVTSNANKDMSLSTPSLIGQYREDKSHRLSEFRPVNRRLSEYRPSNQDKSRRFRNPDSISEDPESSSKFTEPRFHTPIIMNTETGRKLRMLVDIGPPFTPENINVKSTSRKVIIEARKIEVTGEKRERLGFTREVKLPEAINPHSLRARFSDTGKLTLTAMVKT